VVKVIHLLASDSSDILMSNMARGKEDMFEAFVNKELGKGMLSIAPTAYESMTGLRHRLELGDLLSGKALDNGDDVVTGSGQAQDSGDELGREAGAGTAKPLKKGRGKRPRESMKSLDSLPSATEGSQTRTSHIHSKGLTNNHSLL
jgi:TATA-binding protein-associated factor